MQINCNASGNHGTDVPVVIHDSGFVITGFWESNNRCLFRYTANLTGGANLMWSNHSERVLMPMPPFGSVEASNIGWPALVYGTSITGTALSVRPGDGFMTADKPFLWKGATFLRGAARHRDGEDLRAQVDQIQRAGGNLIRSSAMLAWANYNPTQPGYWDAVERYWDFCESEGIRLQWTVFERDSRTWLPQQDQQLAVWSQTIDRMRHRWAVVPDLINEFDTVPGVDPRIFPRPTGLCASRGSGGTDTPYFKPAWDFAPFHVRRDNPPDSRGFAQGDHYNWETNYPKPEIVVPEEWIKPQSYGNNLDYAFRMGQRAGINGGGTFHSDAGVQAVVMDSQVEACMKAFFDGAQSAWRYQRVGDIVRIVIDDMAGGCITSLEADRIPVNSYSHGLNVELKSIGGGKAIIGKRKGCVALNAGISGTGVANSLTGLHEFRTGGTAGDAGYKISTTNTGDIIVWNDAGAIIGGVINAGDPLFEGGIAYVSFADANGHCYMVDGVNAWRFGPNDNIRWMGIAAPTTTHAVAAYIDAGGHNGHYETRVTFYDPVSQIESSAGPTAATSVDPAGQTIQWTSLPTSTPLNGSPYQRRLYVRNTATMRNFYLAATVEDGVSTTYITGPADSALTLTGPDTASNNRPPATSKYLAWHHNRMFTADDHNLYYSHLPADGIAHPEEFDAAAIEPVFPEDGQVIKGIFSAFDVLVVLKTSSVIVLIGDDPDTWSLRVVDPGIGCVAPNSITYASDRLYWWGEQGPAAWDGGSTPVWIGTPLISDTLTTITQDPAVTFNFRVARDFNRDRVLFAVASVNSTTNNTILPFNHRLSRWESDDWEIIDVTSMAEFQDASGQPYPALGSSVGQIFKLGFGLNDGVPGGTMTGTFVASGTTATTITDGAAAFYTTGTAKLAQRKVTIIDSNSKRVGQPVRIQSNTATVLTLQDTVTGLTNGATYTYMIGSINFEWDSPWWTADDGLLKKRFMFIWAAPRWFKENGTLQLETATNYDVRSTQLLTHTTTATVTGDSLIWGSAGGKVWGTNVWAVFRQTPFKRARVGRAGVVLQLRLRHYHYNSDFDIPWLGYECERLTERLG